MDTIHEMAVIRRLQRCALRTQFFPFTLFYRALYAAAIWICARRLGRLPGVRSVYLRRGLAKGRPVYGLSDIDLLVLVDSDSRDRDLARVRNRYESLRRIIPMLADGELALYHPEEFRSLYTYSPFYRHRFDRGRHDWRRLRGADVFACLPPPDEARLADARFELLSAWRYLSYELLAEDPRPAFVRRYVAYKMIADAAQVWLATHGDERAPTRETALARVAEAIPHLAPRLEAIRRWRDHPLASQEVPVDDVLDTFHALARDVLSRQPARMLPQRELRIAAAPPGEIERQLGSAVMTLLEEASRRVAGVQRAILVPRLNFDPLATVGLDPAEFAGATVDSFDLILMGQRLPEAAQLRELNRRLAPLGPQLTAFFSDGVIALALRPFPGWTVRERVANPELFAAAAEAPAADFLTVAGALAVVRPFEHADSLERRASSLLVPFLGPQVFQMPPREFFLVFWEALRAAFLVLQKRTGPVEVPVTSRQIVDALAAVAPAEEHVLREILEEYSREGRGEPSALGRYPVWAAAYARKLLGLVDPSRHEDVGLPKPPALTLSASVVIPTRNRAGMLRQALASLANQSRPPDEVVVVDNDSSDDTAAVALSFRDRLNVKLVRAERIGIPHARNAGLRHATGDIVGFLDDDCVAASDWLEEMEKPFLQDPHLGAVGGNLLPMDGQTELAARFFASRMEDGAP